jgi:hypothetical protein
VGPDADPSISIAFPDVVGVHGLRIEDDSIVHHGSCRHVLEDPDQIHDALKIVDAGRTTAYVELRIS